MTIPKKIKAFGYDWKVIKEKGRYGGSFDFGKRIIGIGDKCNRKDEVLLHELMEMVMTNLYCRFEGGEGSMEYVFHFKHTDFCNIVGELFQILKDNKLIS